MLGAALYQNEEFEEAEKVFRDELKKYPHNGRGLFGLKESLLTQEKITEAEEVDKEFIKAWINADVILSMTDL